ncbi:C-type lectin domain family 7 member A-like isoform X2 [Neopsephotus bourkii]|uniref:C-type lectin domain family 7 member A-like isoform X2 n=1 Tax=Neopsephotus bourkii TaxID=309878 RepID=UPI002AA5DCAC|nr:C-type lectin domain family 7 member A-like isoform X2 [Neopsephotus bourkii]
MSEKLIYADLNLTESTRPKLQKVTDVQDSTYAEVKVQSLDRSAAVSYTSSGKSCCSRTRVAVLVAVIILLLVLAVCLILMYHPTASRPADSKTFSITCEDAHALGLELTTENGKDPTWYGENQKQNHKGCPKHWEKYGGKCYFFSQRQNKSNWNDSRKECTDMEADLVIIDNKDELIYNPLLAVYTKHPYTAANTFTVRCILVVQVLHLGASLCKHAPMGRTTLSAEMTSVLKTFSIQTKTYKQTLICERVFF